jgi:hypothetical protein
MKAIMLAISCLFVSYATLAQSFETDQQAKEQISKLAFMTGHWEGTGWMMGQDRQKHHFTQTEDIQFKLDQTALLIEGKGTSEGKVIHNALAIVTFNKKDNNYTFQSHLATGRGGEFRAELVDNKFYWYPNANLRYIIYLNDKGQWYETGEMNTGTTWFQFFEMTLTKK